MMSQQFPSELDQAQSKKCLESCTPGPDGHAQQTLLKDSESLLKRFTIQHSLEVLRKVTYVILGVIVFAALRNSITWHLEHFWGASGDFWQAQWGKFYTLFGEDDFSVGFYGSAVLFFSMYWIVCLLFLFIDLTGQPAFIYKYKIQDGQNDPAVPPPQDIPLHPQDAPRVDRADQCRRHLLPPSRASLCQRPASPDRTSRDGVPHRDLHALGQRCPDVCHHLPLWLPPATPAIARSSRLPSSQIHQQLWDPRHPGPPAWDRRPLQAEQAVSASCTPAGLDPRQADLSR